ncbi:MAG: hypothetical protein ACRD5F_04125 [Candidatus Acidiferrales bacterium]
MRAKCFANLLLAMVFLPALTARAQREPPVQKELMERFGEWADHYTASLPSYTALETVRQTRFGRGGKPGDERAATYGYTLQRVAGSPGAFEESRAPAAAGENGDKPSGKLRDEASIGLFSKAALLVTRFATRYHSRMKYFFVPEHPDAVSEFVVVGYRQSSGEGLMEVDGKLVFPAGRAWIDANDGKIIRLEEEFGNVGKTRYSISVDFAVVSELARHTDDAAARAWLPARVVVRIFDKDRLELQNEYTYSAFRPLN